MDYVNILRLRNDYFKYALFYNTKQCFIFVHLSYSVLYALIVTSILFHKYILILLLKVK